jgi:hypothetical protein
VGLVPIPINQRAGPFGVKELVTSPLQRAVNAGTPNLKLACRFGRPHATFEQHKHLVSLRAGCRCAALVFALSLGPRDAFALTLQHDLPFELRDGADRVDDLLP